MPTNKYECYWNALKERVNGFKVTDPGDKELAEVIKSFLNSLLAEVEVKVDLFLLKEKTKTRTK